MLSELAIRNFAIIDDIRIRFADGMTVMTGETGAGKSIIINAVNLLLGSRAATRMIRTGCDLAEVEALFHPPQASPSAKRMQAHDMDPAEGLLIRRVIAANGNHRVYINGRLATAQLLSDLTGQLANIAGQHAHQRLLDETLHLEMLDQYAGLVPLRTQYQEGYAAITALLSERSALVRKKSTFEKEAELYAFQSNEIREADLHPGEGEALESERQRLRHSEALFGSLGGIVEGLYAAEGSVTEQLSAMRKELERACTIDESLSDAGTMAEDLGFRCEDLAERLRQYLDTLEVNPARLDAVEERLHLIGKLKKKYGATIEEILAHQEWLCAQTRDFASIDATISDLDRSLANSHKALVATANTLSEKRKTAAKKLGKAVEKELSDLKMEGTRFRVGLTKAETRPSSSWLMDGETPLTEWGREIALFLIAPNVGETEKPLAKIASGGELSRIVLALKVILAKTEAVSTVVFDEADAGIGGSVAEAVGRKMHTLSASCQVICITHLAQIAKFGDHHFHIAKQVAHGRTRTAITPLSSDDRPEELARMIGGEAISETTLEHARELLAETGEKNSP